MSYFEPSNYETSDNIMANTGRKKGSLLCFGLPLGSGVVLIALINSIFTAHSILNFIEILSITGSFSVKDHLLPVGMVGFFLVLTVYLWVAVIFTGRSYHVSIWIAGSLLLLLLKVVISSWTLLLSLSLKDALYWRKLWVLGVDICMEVYIISVSVIAANVLWRRDDGIRADSSGHSQYQRYLGSDVDLDLGSTEASLSSSSSSFPLPLSPVGLKPRAFAQFYIFPNNIELGTRMLVLLDVIYSTYILATEKIPQVLLTNRDNKYDEELLDYFDDVEVGSFTISKFGEKRLILIFIEDTIIRLGRVLIGLVAVSYLMKQRTSSQKLGHALLAQLALITMSMLIYFILFGIFEQLSTSDRFYQIKFTLDILLRLGLIGCLTKAVERRRLNDDDGGTLVGHREHNDG